MVRPWQWLRQLLSFFFFSSFQTKVCMDTQDVYMTKTVMKSFVLYIFPSFNSSLDMFVFLYFYIAKHWVSLFHMLCYCGNTISSAFNNNLNNAFFFLWLEFILKWSSVSEYLRRSFLMFPLWSPVSLVPAVVEKALWAHMSIKSTRVNTGVTLEIKGLLFFIIFIFYLWWILSYIEMKQPWVYMCSPSRSPLPLPSPPAPSRFTQCTRSERLSHASNLGWWSVSP